MTPQPSNWATKIAEIKAAGLSQQDLERKTFMSTAALKALAEGAQPLHFKGDKLDAVWREVTGGTSAPEQAALPAKNRGGRPRKVKAA